MKTVQRARQRGFTLVELLVATTAGLIVSAAAFLLAQNSAAVFQEETRITAAQMSASLGLQRLASDIGRAGFLSTPNITTDPFVCNESGTWPPLLANLRAVRIGEAGSVVAHGPDLADSTTNGFAPDDITIASSIDNSEEFPVRTIQPGGVGKIVFLETNNSQVKRTCREAPLATCLPKFQAIFKPDRIIRIVTPEGNQIFGLSNGVSLTGDQLVLGLQTTPVVPAVGVNPKGYRADCWDCKVNAISVIRYELQSLKGHPTYGPLVAPIAAAGTGDDRRTELTRVELDPAGLPIANTLELVSEFAVDLKFGISFVSPGNNGMTDIPAPLPANPLIYTTPPETLRSVNIRFSTRARAPDRVSDIAGGPDGRRYRFKLGITTNPSYTRLRTLYTQVALQNLVKYW